MTDKHRMWLRRDGLYQYWRVTGELRNDRFEVPEGEPVAFDEARMTNVDFSGLRVSSFSAQASVFEGCDFLNARFDEASLGSTTGGARWDPEDGWPQTVYRDCLFRRVQFPESTFFGNSRFERCVFDRARLRNALFTHAAEFVDCRFVGKVREVNFWGRPSEHMEALGRDRNEFRGNDFTAAELSWVAFNHIDLRAQRFPGLPDYALLDEIGARVAAALAVIATWADQRVREEAALDLEFLAEKAKKNNKDEALVCRANLVPTLPPDDRSRIFDLLVGYGETQQ